MLHWLSSFLGDLFSRFLAMLGLRSQSVTFQNYLQIHVKTTTGKNVLVLLHPSWDVGRVKQEISPKVGIEPDLMKIIFAGKELSDNINLKECDLGQQSILHAVKVVRKEPPIEQKKEKTQALPHENVGKPLCETMLDLQLTEEDRNLLQTPEDKVKSKAHFYVYCTSPCGKLSTGKLRVRCSNCKEGAFTVSRDPCNWDDVLLPNQIPGLCEFCGPEPQQLADFYFKCAEHPSQGETDRAVPLYLIRSNTQDVPCLACMEIKDPVLVFSCEASHVICIECFTNYCRSRLMERQFLPHDSFGYTLGCAANCADSWIKESHHFRVMGDEWYARYQRFGAEEYVLAQGGVLCPQPGCGMGLLPEAGCKRVHCQNGCGFVFCRDCLQGSHIGPCVPQTCPDLSSGTPYNFDPSHAAQARWEEESRITIRVITKPCPKCRTPTERDGGCMHMVCTRSTCGFHWCWVCQTEWTRECMGNHWFG